jgi:hypothetical protein
MEKCRLDKLYEEKFFGFELNSWRFLEKLQVCFFTYWEVYCPVVYTERFFGVTK